MARRTNGINPSCADAPPTFTTGMPIPSARERCPPFFCWSASFKGFDDVRKESRQNSGVRGHETEFRSQKPEVRSGRFWRNGLLIGALLFAIGGGMEAKAGSKVKVFGATLFVAGMGVKFGGILTKNTANQTYDDYLTTAVAADIQTLREDYRSQKRLADGLSAGGNGMMVAGALLTAYAIVRSNDAMTPALSFVPARNGRPWYVAWRRRF